MDCWRFLAYDTYSPVENMAIDEAMMIAHRDKRTPPTIRFYGWEVPTLSIGYFQRTKEINLKEINRRHYGFVRRLTGGRAVLHDQELTYSVVVSCEHSGMGESVRNSHQMISDCLLKGFRRLGIKAELAPVMKGRSHSAACFDSPSDYELVVEGKKIVGSAQTRHKGIILQHGSILLQFDVDRLLDLLYFSSEVGKEKYRKSVMEKVISINDVLKEPIGVNSLSKAMVQGFEEGFNVCLREGNLIDEEAHLVCKLSNTRYANEVWNRKK